MSRGRAVLVLVVLGVGAFALSLPTWVSAAAATTLGPQPVAVSGAGAAPVVPSAALVVVVAGLAVGLSGKVVRILAPAAAALAAVVALIGVITLIVDPEPAARSAAGEISGVREIDGMAQVSPWPWVVAVLLGLTVLVAVLLPLRAGAWTPAARKYERPTGRQPSPAAGPDARSDWDALSSGVDPSADGGPDEAEGLDAGAAPDGDEEQRDPVEDGHDPPRAGR